MDNLRLLKRGSTENKPSERQKNAKVGLVQDARDDSLKDTVADPEDERDRKIVFCRGGRESSNASNLDAVSGGAERPPLSDLL